MSGEQTTPSSSRIRILLVGGSAEAASALRATLDRAKAMEFEIIHAQRLAQALALPHAREADVMLLHVEESDLPRLSALTQARLSAPLIPVVVLSEIDDEAIALRALQNGARGYLVTSEINPRLLVTTLGVALESHRMTLQLNSARERARHLATHDQLTGLANRSLFQDRLSQAVSAARRGRQKLAVLFVNLDGFKTINDTLGHAVGDGLLRGIARRFSSCLRETDTAARLGGDEFAVLLTNLSNELDGATVARKLLHVLGQPLQFRRQSTSIRCSIGIATFPRDASDAEELVKKADTATYHAKERGGSRFEFYTEDMNAAIQRRVALEERLRTALDDKQLVLHYQPQFDLTRGRIIGAEALLRWQHPELGLVSPSHFLSMAEETGLIVPIGDWVLRTACEQNAIWNRAEHHGLRVSVNVSSQQFLEVGFANVVRRTLEESGLAPVSLELEITESSLLRDVEITVNTLRSLKDLGVRLAIDDFGTGYSALAYLKRLPIDVLKIDKSFVRALTTDPADATITEAIVQLASGLNLTTIAEGVETLEQLLLLGSYGCNRMQGYLFGKPVPAQIFEQWLADPPFRWVQGQTQEATAE
ncbi:MAG: EAL domain-containing protein [Myxococcales bacterium]|nr:EAL domain-containing protein [Myxococcales bacterium]MDH5565533.1 EAL domain-containing protein [Myxococcales bacterium]